MKHRIGVAISTHDRRDVFTESVDRWRQNMPAGARLVVVDDASREPVPDIAGVDSVIRHDYRRGVAMVKNRCIAELIDAGCDHLFLSDDDVYPRHPDWWRPYVESPEQHLMYGWPGNNRQQHANPNWPPRIAGGDQLHDAYSFPRGVLLYLTRGVVDTVGGMSTAHGVFSGEHVEFSGRVHAAGLTRWPFADVKDSHRLWYARDREIGNTAGSSFSLDERRRMHRANGVHWDRRFAGWPHFPYREGSDVQDYDLGPRIAGDDRRLLAHVLACRPHGAAVEFGVGSGGTLAMIAARMPATGFDSFAGLPERWRDGFDAGMFACIPPAVPGADIVTGLFADTLPAFDFAALGPIGLWHIDCDLHSSTATVLEYIRPHLLPGSYVVFDEYHGYDGCEQHEQRAWREFADTANIGWAVIGHGREQWAVRVL